MSGIILKLHLTPTGLFCAGPNGLHLKGSDKSIQGFRVDLTQKELSEFLSLREIERITNKKQQQ